MFTDLEYRALRLFSIVYMQDIGADIIEAFYQKGFDCSIQFKLVRRRNGRNKTKIIYRYAKRVRF